MFTSMLTMGQVVPWIPSHLCMHMGTCAKWRNGRRAHKAILYKIVDKLGKIKQGFCTLHSLNPRGAGEIKQAMHNILRGLFLPYCLGSRLKLQLALKTSLVTTAVFADFRGKVVFSNDHVLVHISLCGGILQFAPKLKMAEGSLVF